MSDAIFFAPLRVPVVDERTGLMSREWILFFQAMFLRVGGTQAFNPEDLQLVADVNDATNDGSDIRAYTADLERALALADEPLSTSAADVAELQALSASFAEDPIIARFTAQWDGMTPASGGGTLNFLRADGAWSVPASPAVPVGANPTASVGPAVVNGAALTFMRSDAAPAIDLTAAYPWAGLHTFSAQETRKAHDTAFLSFYNTANNVRSGYLQISAAGTSFLNVEAAQALNIRTSNTDRIALGATGGVTIITTVGFNNTAPIAKPTITGSRAANAALASLLTSLASYGLVTDSTTV